MSYLPPIAPGQDAVQYLEQVMEFFSKQYTKDYIFVIHRGFDNTTVERNFAKANVKFEIFYQLIKRPYEVLFVNGVCLCRGHTLTIDQCKALYTRHNLRKKDREHI